jgi:hypothetical protein
VEAGAVPASVARARAPIGPPPSGQRPAGAPPGKDEPRAAERAEAGNGKRPAGGEERRDAAATRPPAEEAASKSEPADQAPAEGSARSFTLSVYPHDAEYRIGDGPWRRISGKTAMVEVGPGEAKLAVRKQPCCDEREQVIGPAQPGGTIQVELPFMPGSVRATCAARGVTVQVDGQSATLGHWRNVMVDGTTGSKQVTVTFVGATPDQIDDQTIVVEAGVGKDVVCRL